MDTIDSKILNKYGVFINRSNPGSIHIKSNRKFLENIDDDFSKIEEMNSRNEANIRGNPSEFILVLFN
jgi:hypothetical protein